MNPAARPIFKSIVILVLLSAALFTATGHMDTLINTCGGAVLSEANRTYLDESFDRSMKGFLVLSAIKSGLAVLEGSEVGVGFNLEVGDIVQSIYDYVDVAWKTALAGGTILLLIQLILLASLIVGSWVNLQRQLDLLQHDVQILLQNNETFCSKLENLQAASISYEYRLQSVERQKKESSM